MGRGEHYRAVLADESTDDHEAAKNRNTENKSAMETRPKEERIKKNTTHSEKFTWFSDKFSLMLIPKLQQLNLSK